MARYFFDLQDNADYFLDPEGSEIDNVDAAREEAVRALVEMARDALPDGPSPRKMSMIVLDEARRPLVSVSISFELRAVS